VSRGTRTPEIARNLKEAGIISDDKVFLAAAYITGSYRRMKAGEYLFQKNASMADVMSLIISGKELVYKVTVPEGWTTAQVIDRVSAHESLVGEIGDLPPEGAILPETYIFRRGMTRDGLIRQMRSAQEKLFDEIWAGRAPGLPFKTKEEALILASIVEKETSVPAERPQVAAVFINRLRAGMRLQSDPTIIYGITQGKTKLERPILRSDIDAATPYNTYRIAGLPPTPIANPGRESIAAVLNPIDTKDLYFVADGSGGHVFAATLEEHRKNVRKWRAVEKTFAAEADAAADAPEVSVAAPPESPVVAEPPLTDEAAPAETAGYDTAEVTAAVRQPAARSQPPAQTQDTQVAGPRPGSLVIVSGRLVPIPAKRPQRN
jgi:peptidoglycan lytic transglycosylase G